MTDTARPAAGLGINVIPAEARPYQGRTAGVVTRSAAGAVDFGYVVLILVGIYLAWVAVRFLVRPRSFTFPQVSWETAVIAGALILATYFTIGWSVRGRTYGDVLLGIRVVDRAGLNLRLPVAIVRAVLCTGFPIGLFWSALSRENRSLQDLIVRTSVIYDWEPRSDGRPASSE